MGRAIGVGDLAVSDFGQCSTIHIYVPITKKIRPLVIDLIAQRNKKKKKNNLQVHVGAESDQVPERRHFLLESPLIKWPFSQ